QWIRGLSGP
ncbi:hypothetical protein HKBW3S42_00672, partial [Candidatus Hakubella thermalkaliphila]